MHILNEIVRGIWAINPESIALYMPLVARILNGDLPQNATPHTFEQQASIASMVGSKPAVASIGKVFFEPDAITEPSVFIMNISGPITKYDQACGPAGMKSKAGWLSMADKHPNIFAHLITIDSGGGESYAAKYMADHIAKLKKPVFAFVEGMAASAAYGIASATRFIAASSEMDRIGSVGTILTIMDMRDKLKADGINLIEVYATKSTEKNIEHRKALLGDTSLIQQHVDIINEFFINQVQNNRPQKLNNNQWQAGKIFFANDALQLGIIDQVTSLENLLSDIFDSYNSSKL